jgi:hypothetical protein
MKVSVHQQGDFIENEEFLLPDGVRPALSMLQSARKARVQKYLDEQPQLATHAQRSKRYTQVRFAPASSHPYTPNLTAGDSL